MVIPYGDGAIVLDSLDHGVHIPCTGHLSRVTTGYHSWSLVCDTCHLRIEIPNVVTNVIWLDIFLELGISKFVVSWAFQRRYTTEAEQEFVLQNLCEYSNLTSLFLAARE